MEQRTRKIAGGLSVVPSLGLENLGQNRVSIPSDRKSSSRTQIAKSSPYERQVAHNISLGIDQNTVEVDP